MEEFKKWIDKAKDDLEKSVILIEKEKYDGATFFCQQAVEKALKALILKEKNKLLKIHDLVILGREINLPTKYIDYCKELTLSYVYSRYPDLENNEDIKEIAYLFIRYAKEIIEWIIKKL